MGVVAVAPQPGRGQEHERGLVDLGRMDRHDFRRLQHALRLEGAQYARVEPASVEADVTAVRELWAAVFGS